MCVLPTSQKPESRAETDRVFAGSGFRMAGEGDILAHKAEQRAPGSCYRLRRVCLYLSGRKRSSMDRALAT